MPVVGITGIVYNFLGKPIQMTFSSGKVINYTYDATGSKLTMSVTESGTTVTTDYVNGFVYQGGNLSFFGSPEGRVVKNGSSLEYQYSIADHQGNTRVVFTSAAPTVTSSTADFENSTNGDFQNYTNRITFELMDHTDVSGSTYTYSQKLTGGSNSQVGVTKTMKVYPGDKVKIEAYAKYYNATSNTSNLSGFALALTGAFGVSSGSTGEALKAYNTLNNYGGIIASGGGGGNSSYPKLFVNILLFDKNYNFLDASWQQIDGGEQVGASPKAAHDYMSTEITAREGGFAYVYVSNENPTLVEFYVDDVVVTNTPSNVIQYNEYYPFGLQTSSSWNRENTTGNNYLYNAANELNKDNGWYEMHYRGYDPATGRMLQIDPYATMYASATTYNYSLNNPVMMNDPSGGQTSVRSALESLNRPSSYMARVYAGYANDWASDGGFSNGAIEPIFYSSADAMQVISRSWDGNVPMDVYDDKGNKWEMEDVYGIFFEDGYGYYFSKNNVGIVIERGKLYKGELAYDKRTFEKVLEFDIANSTEFDPFGDFGEFFEDNYNGGVVYDGSGLYGSNFLGPGSSKNPYRLKDPKNKGQYLKPKNMVDASAQRHDNYYCILKSDGVVGALFDKQVAFADAQLAAEAAEAYFGYFKGKIDPVTGEKISPRTRDMAFDVMITFGIISLIKMH